jgi:hypothetical protein
MERLHTNSQHHLTSPPWHLLFVCAGADGEEGYNQMLAELPPVEGRYIAYDFDFKTKEGGVRNKLLLIVWAPGTYLWCW